MNNRCEYSIAISSIFILPTGYPTATWYTEKVEEFNGKNISIIEILTPATDTKIYNLIVSMELDGRLLTCSFNCTEDEMKDWKTIVKTIMNSIELSKWNESKNPSRLHITRDLYI